MMTSLGPGKVYDAGDMTGEWIDIYTNWGTGKYSDEYVQNFLNNL